MWVGAWIGPVRGFETILRDHAVMTRNWRQTWALRIGVNEEV